MSHLDLEKSILSAVANVTGRNEVHTWEERPGTTDKDRNQSVLLKHGPSLTSQAELRPLARVEGVAALPLVGAQEVAIGYRLTSANAASVNGSNHWLGALEWKRRVVKAGRGGVGRGDATQL